MNNNRCLGTIGLGGQTRNCLLPAYHSLPCKFSTVFISRAKFNEYRGFDYASEIDGVPHLLTNHHKQGTMLWPVKILGG